LKSDSADENTAQPEETGLGKRLYDITGKAISGN